MPEKRSTPNFDRPANWSQGTMTQPAADQPGPSQRPAGIVILAGSILSVFAMAHHPSVSASGAAAMAEMAREAGLAGLVHGTLIAMMVAMIYGFWVFAERLDLSAGVVRLGTVSYVAGVGAMIGAALISGFVVAALGASYAGAEAGAIEAASPVLAFGHAANQALAKLGVIAMSAAILLWSVRLTGRTGADRAIGWLGVAIGVLPAALLLSGQLRLDVAGMGAVVIAQGVWNVAVGTQLIRRRF
jgi:hypothetical protein